MTFATDGEAFESLPAKGDCLPLIKIGQIPNLDIELDVAYLKDYLCVKLNENEKEPVSSLKVNIYSINEGLHDCAEILIGENQLPNVPLALDVCPPLT